MRVAIFLCVLLNVNTALATFRPSAEDRVLELIAQTFGVSPLQVYNHGPGLWILAVDENYVRVLQWLFDNRIPGRDLNLPDGDGNLWHLAVSRGNIRALCWMAAHHIPGSDIVFDRRSLRDYAISEGQREVVRWLDTNLLPAQMRIVADAIPVMMVAFSHLNAAR